MCTNCQVVLDVEMLLPVIYWQSDAISSRRSGHKCDIFWNSVIAEIGFTGKYRSPIIATTKEQIFIRRNYLYRNVNISQSRNKKRTLHGRIRRSRSDDAVSVVVPQNAFEGSFASKPYCKQTISSSNSAIVIGRMYESSFSNFVKAFLCTSRRNLKLEWTLTTSSWFRKRGFLQLLLRHWFQSTRERKSCI